MQRPGLVPLIRLPWWVWRTNRKPGHWEINRRPCLSPGLGVGAPKPPGPGYCWGGGLLLPSTLDCRWKGGHGTDSRWNTLIVEAQQCRGRRMAEMTFDDH